MCKFAYRISVEAIGGIGKCCTRRIHHHWVGQFQWKERDFFSHEISVLYNSRFNANHQVKISMSVYVLFPWDTDALLSQLVF